MHIPEAKRHYRTYRVELIDIWNMSRDVIAKHVCGKTDIYLPAKEDMAQVEGYSHLMHIPEAKRHWFKGTRQSLHEFPQENDSGNTLAFESAALPYDRSGLGGD